MSRRAWVLVPSALSVLLVPLLSATASGSGTPLITEPFTTSTPSSTNWSLPAVVAPAVNDACLTGATDTSQKPIPACASTTSAPAGLQLTPNSTGQEGGVLYTSSVPSDLGLDATFTSYQYGQSTTNHTAADGISFFLAGSDPTNAAASPITLGPLGGHLGYSADPGGSTAGLTNGYLGIGLDVYGNYTASAFDGSGCSEGSTPATQESVTVRGPGNGTAGYCLLTHQASGTLDSLTATAVPVEVAVNPTGNDTTTASGLSVPAHNWAVSVQPIGASPFVETGALPNATGIIRSDWLGAGGVPNQLSFGWAASTGAATDFHTISGVQVSTLFGTPPALGVDLTDDSGGNAHSGQTVTYTATVSVSAANEANTITLTDTFPGTLIPQSTPGGTGWTCDPVVGQTVKCTHAGASVGTLADTLAMPVTVNIPSGSPPTSVDDTATVGSPDATQGSDTDTQTYLPAPTATALAVTSQPVSAQVNQTMRNPDSSQTHVQVAAQVTSGGATDTTYTGNVTLAFANNPGNAKFVVAGNPVSSITVAAVSGVADFSPIVINAVGFGYTLQATASGLTSATTNSFDITGAATSCPTGQTCSVTTTSPGTGDNAVIQAQPGTGNAIITASYGGNVQPIRPCTGAIAGILTFSGDRQKVITLTFTTKKVVLLFCYGQPTPFLDVTFRPAKFNPANNDYEGVLPPCLPRFTGPCVRSISFSKSTEKAVILSGAADPHLMH